MDYSVSAMVDVWLPTVWSLSPARGLSNPVLPPCPGGKGEEGRLPECELWGTAWTEPPLCDSGLWGQGGVGHGSLLAAATVSVWIFLLLLSFPPLR